MDSDLEPTPTRSVGRYFTAGTIGCMAVPTLLVTLGVFGLLYYQYTRLNAHEVALAEQAEKAEQAFGGALDKMEEDKPQNPEVEVVDVDKTIRVIHEIDLALTNYDNFEDYLSHVGRQDYRGVAPEILDARRDLLEKVRELYAKQTEMDQQEALFDFTKGMMLETLSVVEAEGEWGTLGPTGSFSLDRDHAKELLAEYRENQRSQERRIQELGEVRDDLFEAMLQYSEVYYGYIEEWDRLCVLRDRGYLAAVEGDWPTVEASARAAMEQAPEEREAHLLLARAIIEQNDPERRPEAGKILEDLIEEHPGQSAPALLLLGVLARQSGDMEQARLNLQQAAAYYPKQAGELTDMLNPYKMRQFLRKSRDGTVILEAYEDTMRGAGSFSPELQLAQIAFESGDFEAGKRRVLDHFARRRAQQQWDFVLSDLAYAQDLMGTDVHQIFPEAGWLSLKIGRPMFTGGITVGVENRTDDTLHNATLVLLVQFTDMHPGDYRTFSAQTQPALKAHTTTDFGVVEVGAKVLGEERGPDNIVRHRAILMTDEAVVWVDTDEYKIQQVEAVAKARQRNAENPVKQTAWVDEMTTKMQDIAGELPATATLEIEPTLGRDSVVFQLPREIAILQPVFRLTYGGQTYTARENRIDGDHITLRFDAVEDFTKDSTEELELGIQTIFGDLSLGYTPDGEMKYSFDRIEQ